MKMIKIAALAALPMLFIANAGATTVRVHYDAGKGSVAIVGDKGPMSWSKGAAAKAGAGNVWSYSWPDELGAVSMKPALGEQVSIGGVYKLAAGSTVDIYPFFGAPFGKVSIMPGIVSPQLKNSRSLRIYLPPSYQENAAKRYPVLYMHDGQNLFDAKTAAYGVEWGIDETVNRLIATGAMDEVIVVGIDNTPDRIPEYTPCCDPKHGGGKLDAYEAFIIDTVKPLIDKTLRTLPGKDTTAIMGSSLGGIASVAIAQHHPEVFSKAGGVSSSFWWNDKALIAKLPTRVPVRFYIDAGTNDDGLAETMLMRDAMLRRGYLTGVDLFYYAAEGGSHNEKSWAARVDKPLTWFFPWGSTTY
ncbi:MAG: alpha/beta hydrolase-fold protein [Pseudomonadota bacterium]|nr:alpha/beta hydrolase-fold protein [Pseudomonadota bacterium]